MATDIELLTKAEQDLLEIMEIASNVSEGLGKGTDPGKVRADCERFIDLVQESQLILLKAATRHEIPKPYRLHAYAERLSAAASLEAVAARRQVERPRAIPSPSSPAGTAPVA